MRILLVIVTALALLAAAPKPFHYEQAIRQLAWTTPATIQMGPFTIIDEDQPPVIRNHCTIWAYQQPSNPSKTHWITAAHCILDEETGAYEDHDYQIDGHRVYPEYWLWPQDIASLSGDYDAPGLLLGSPVSVEDIVAMRGYIFGNDSAMVTVKGTVAALGFHFPGNEWFYTLLQMPIAPGNSGSPIFDHNDGVIGVAQVGFNGYSPIAGALDYRTFRLFLADLP